jgi:hypothetical protein
LELAVPLEVRMDHGWEQLPLEPGKEDAQVVQCVADSENLLQRNKDDILSHIQADAPNLQERLEEMVDRMKNMWRVATDDQKSAWNETKRQSFTAKELNTRLIDVMCSFESRWIPHEHCACQICWEGGLFHSEQIFKLARFCQSHEERSSCRLEECQRLLIYDIHESFGKTCLQTMHF